MLLGEVDELWGDCWILMLRRDSPRWTTSFKPSARLWRLYKRRKMQPSTRRIRRLLATDEHLSEWRAAAEKSRESTTDMSNCREWVSDRPDANIALQLLVKRTSDQLPELHEGRTDIPDRPAGRRTQYRARVRSDVLIDVQGSRVGYVCWQCQLRSLCLSLVFDGQSRTRWSRWRRWRWRMELRRGEQLEDGVTEWWSWEDAKDAVVR